MLSLRVSLTVYHTLLTESAVPQEHGASTHPPLTPCPADPLLQSFANRLLLPRADLCSLPYTLR